MEEARGALVAACVRQACQESGGEPARVANYFTHRISNAMSEGFNSVIQQLKAAGRDFRNFSGYRRRILFFCGKLDLKPTV